MIDMVGGTTRHPAATAKMSSALESAPPDTAQCRIVPAAGNVQRREQFGNERCSIGGFAGALRSRPRDSSHCWGSRISAMVGSESELVPRLVDDALDRRRVSSTWAMNASPAAYWLSLASRPTMLLHDAGKSLGGLTAGAQCLGEELGVGHDAEASAVHGDIAVAFEQAHHAGDLVEHDASARGRRSALEGRRWPVGRCRCAATPTSSLATSMRRPGSGSTASSVSLTNETK